LQRRGQFAFHIACDIRLLLTRVLFRGGDSEPVPINPNHALEFVEQRFCEKTRAAVGVD
jgi:hypothetical protein